MLKSRLSDFKTKIQSDEQDLKALSCKVKEQFQIIEIARDTVARKVREISDKQKELAEAQIKIVELNGKLDRFQNSQFIMNHMLNIQKPTNDVTGVGYSDVPFNDNYSFVQSKEKSH